MKFKNQFLKLKLIKTKIYKKNYTFTNLKIKNIKDKLKKKLQFVHKYFIKFIIQNKKILSINNSLTIETKIKKLSKNPTQQKAFYTKTLHLKNKSYLIYILLKLLFFFLIFFFLGLHFKKKKCLKLIRLLVQVGVKLIRLLVRVGVKVLIVKLAFHCFGSSIFFFKFLFNKKILSLNALVKKILYACIMDYLPIDSGLFEKTRNVSNIFFIG